MKKTILIITAVAISAIAQGQDHKKMWLSGTVKLNTTSNDNDTKTTGLTFQPVFGYYIKPRLAIGLGLGLTANKTDVKDGPETKVNEMYIAPFIRYHKPITEKLFVYGELSLAYGAGKLEIDYPFVAGTEDTYNYFQVKLSPGFEYWMHERWSVNAEWGAIRYRANNDLEDNNLENDFKSNEFEIGLDLRSISVGINFFF